MSAPTEQARDHEGDRGWELLGACVLIALAIAVGVFA